MHGETGRYAVKRDRHELAVQLLTKLGVRSGNQFSIRAANCRTLYSYKLLIASAAP